MYRDMSFVTLRARFPADSPPPHDITQNVEIELESLGDYKETPDDMSLEGIRVPISIPSAQDRLDHVKKDPDVIKANYGHSWRVVGCTQPLYGLVRMQKAWPGLIRKWVKYHLHMVGIDHLFIYDNDGSFEEAARESQLDLESYIENKKVTYFPHWMRQVDSLGG